ncbi:MAG: integral membrane sensor signal transduction histidine kinase [uncultured bacterium (gcode 4)]|uniref:histidine kinase n=1 Tax=uncultured bacterium (gcode 4) TaxID=1234023 RepID=K2H168_9BACT|nr:MAG: integral membrane sensor signal transduction histidine kinase [uncultured bacterium (gcode 4)]
MKFSYKFLIATLLILSVMIFANVLALKHYGGMYFSEYLVDFKKQVAEIDSSFLDSILQNKKIDPLILQEYADIQKDLWKISTSLEKFSENPYISNSSLIESLQKSWLPSSTIEQVIGTNALQSFFWNITNFVSLDSSKPEWKFIIRTLVSMAYFNLVLIWTILLLSYIWVVYTFRPVRSIVDNLSDIVYKKEYKNIVYRKKDEFFPLMEAINNLNKSLSLQEKIRSDFLSDLSHEIKTPITAVKCYLEGIEDGIIETSPKNMKMLYDEIERLIKITNSIMEYEKEESRNFWDIFVEKIDFCALVEFVSDEYTTLLARNEQNIVSYVPGEFSIQVDKDKMTQLLHNVFSNFNKYAGKWTTLTIKAYNKASRHFITFSDNGKWVGKEELPFIKEKFYKVEKSRNKNKDSWIGIWLSVIEKIVRLHGWEFYIDSEQKKGFVITIELPR